MKKNMWLKGASPGILPVQPYSIRTSALTAPHLSPGTPSPQFSFLQLCNNIAVFSILTVQRILPGSLKKKKDLNPRPLPRLIKSEYLGM